MDLEFKETAEYNFKFLVNRRNFVKVDPFN